VWKFLQTRHTDCDPPACFFLVPAFLLPLFLRFSSPGRPRQRKDQLLPSQWFAVFLGVVKDFLTEIVRKCSVTKFPESIVRSGRLLTIHWSMHMNSLTVIAKSANQSVGYYASTTPFFSHSRISFGELLKGLRAARTGTILFSCILLR
jgi:hypothetical protein